MTTTKERVGDVMIATVTTEESAIVDYDDIETRGESDEDAGYAPWEECDGYEHEFEKSRYYSHEGQEDSAGWVSRSERNGGSGCIVIDDETVVKWGCTGPTGCSKQVRAETIARAKAKTIDLLVKWYSDGWYVSLASAHYGDYSEYTGGIWDEPWGDYTEECAEECRAEVADQLENDGYEVINRPEPVKPYNRVDAFRDRIRRNLDCSQ
jgi:hypothetical protein